MGTPVPSMTAYSLSGSGDGGIGTSLRAAMSAARSRAAAAPAVPLASAARSTRLTVSRTPASSSSSPAAPANGTEAAARSFIAARPGRHGLPGDAELGVARGEAVPAGRAVIPGPGEGDRAEHRVDDLLPVGGEHGLVAAGRTGRAGRGGPGRRPAPAPSMPPPSFSSPARITASAASMPASPQPRALAASAASRPSSAALSCASAARSPLFPLPSREGSSSPASPGTAGRASQIASFTSVTCPTRSRNRSYPATSRRTLSSSGPGLRCTRPGPALHRPRQVLLRTVARMIRAPRTRSSASRTCGAPRSATRGGSPRPAPSSRYSSSRRRSSSASSHPKMILTACRDDAHPSGVFVRGNVVATG